MTRDRAHVDKPHPTPRLLSSNFSVWAGASVLLLLAMAEYAQGGIPSVAYELIVNGIILAAWLTSAAGIGGGLLRIGRLRDRLFGEERLLRVVVEIALGLGAISIMVLLLGIAGVLNALTAWTIVAGGVTALVVRVALSRKQRESRTNLLTGRAGWNWLWLLVVPSAALVLACATLPPGVLWRDEPNAYDVLEYHLQIPREWHELGRITPLTHNVFSYFPFNVEMHYLLAMHLRGGPWAGMYLVQLMHVAMIALTVVALFALGRFREQASQRATPEPNPPLAFSRRSGLLAALGALSAPWLALLAPIAYNEGGLLLFGTLAIGLALRALNDETHRTRWMLLAGALAGLACGAKLTAVPEVLLAVPLIVGGVLLVTSRRLPVVPLLRFLIAGVMTLSPWLIRNLAWSGDPVFPEGTSVFGRAHFTPDQVERWKRANHEPRPEQQNLPARGKALWDQVLADWRYGYLLIPLALAIALSARNRTAAALLLLLLTLAIFWTFFTHLQSRFFILAIPICALLIAQARRDLALPATILVAIGCAMSWWHVHHKWMNQDADLRARTSGQVALFRLAGLESLKDLAPLQQEVPPDAPRLVLVGDARVFLYETPTSRVQYRTVFDVNMRDGESIVDGWIGDSPVPPGSVILIDPNELERFSRTYWKIPPPPQDVAQHQQPYLIRP